MGDLQNDAIELEDAGAVRSSHGGGGGGVEETGNAPGGLVFWMKRHLPFG
jgi:hypothetical protein